MRFSVLLAFVALAVFVLTEVTATEKREVLSPFEPFQYGWRVVGQPHPSAETTFYLMLKTGKEEELKAFSTEVSDPASPRYKQYMTREQLRAFVAAPVHVEQQVTQWLQEATPTSTPLHLFSYGDAIKVRTTVEHAERLLDTTFKLYKYKSAEKQIVRSNMGARLPSHVADHVTTILGVSNFALPLSISKHGSARLARSERASNDPLIVPSLLKSVYNVSTTLTATQSSIRQGVAAFDDYYNPDALRQFETAFSLPTATVVNTGPASSCLPNCDQTESDLDVQYITAMGTGVETIFRAYPGTEFTAEFAMDVASGSIPANEVAYIYSISYGAPEIGNSGYVATSETQLAKLPALGITIFVSSGDDGATNPPSFGSNGNCPLDTAFYCPFGGCNYTTTKCGGVIISTSDGSECVYPMGAGYQSSEDSQGCTDIFGSFSVAQLFQNWVANVSASCTIAADQDIAGRPWFYSSCPCPRLGGSYSTGGLTFTPYTYNEANGNALAPSYPASSVWVTSVGATQFIGSSAPYSEVAASISNTPPAIITTGGGFSTLQSRPTWQDSVVSNYLATATLPPSSVFNSAGRAYPDVSFNGHNYVVYLNPNGGGDCNPSCSSTEVDGTSASSPGIAGLFALINDQLVANGDNTLGFLNPLLYSMAAADPTTFNDITVGNNKASSAYPCIYGFTTATGWDPVTGLGSPNFNKILAYILANPPDSSAAAQLHSWLHYLN